VLNNLFKSYNVG